MVASPVRSIDIAATSLDLLGLPPKADGQGRSLLPLIYGEKEEEPRDSYGESMHNRLAFDWSPLRSLRKGKWKYIHAPNPELYDLEEDPDELVNRFEEHRELSLSMREDLREFLEATRSAEVEGSSAHALNEESMEKVRSLGYLSGDDSSRRASSMVEFEPKGRDPKEMKKILGLINKAGGLIKTGRLDKAEAMLTIVLAIDPSVLIAREFLGTTLYRQGKIDDSVSVLKELVQMDPDRAEAYRYLSLCMYRKGLLEEATQYQEKAVSLLPHRIDGYHYVAKVYRKAGKSHEAEKRLLLAAEIMPENTKTFELLGKLYQGGEKHEQARKAFEQALKLNPNSWYSNLAMARLAVLRETKKKHFTGDKKRSHSSRRKPIPITGWP